jgi:hypothetical protein
MNRELAVISSVKPGDRFHLISVDRDRQETPTSPAEYDPNELFYRIQSDREIRGTVTQSDATTIKGRPMWLIAFLNESTSPQVWGYVIKDPNLIVSVIRRGKKKKLPDTWRITINETTDESSTEHDESRTENDDPTA